MSLGIQKEREKNVYMYTLLYTHSPNKKKRSETIETDDRGESRRVKMGQQMVYDFCSIFCVFACECECAMNHQANTENP